MADLHDRFRAIDRIAAPDLWSEAVERATASAPALGRTSAPPTWLGPWLGRVPISARLALIAALLIAGLVMVALIGGRSERTTPIVFTPWDQPGLFATDVGGGSSRRIFDDFAQRIHVSPDGRYAFFSDPNAGVAIAATDGSGWRSLDLAGEDFGEDFAGREFESVWAPDSHAVAWISRGTAEATLYVADIVPGHTRRIDLPPPAIPEPGSSRRRPMVWSNDNVHLAYLEWGSCDSAWGSPFIVDTNTGDVRELGSDLEVLVPPVWSGDGRSLAMAVGCRTAGQNALVIGNIESGTTAILAEPLDAYSFSWSPDSLTIRWAAVNADGLALRSVAATGGDIREIARIDADDAVWSRDGTRIAWAQADAGPDGSWSLWVAGAAGGEPQRIAADIVPHALYSSSVWSPDSAWIAFIRAPTHPTDGGRGGSLWIVRPDGRDERLVIDGATIDLDLSSVDW